MANIINIETSTEVCSCALSVNGKIVIDKVNTLGQSHATLLGVFVNEIMKYVRENNLRIDAVAVSCGPGSYTGLRIGVSESKGLSYGLSVPLISIPTHLLMAQSMIGRVGEGTLLCPMIDARRMEVYSTIYDTALNTIRKTSADIIDEMSYSDLLEKHQIVFFGNGANKCIGTISHSNAIFVENIYPLASSMIALSEKFFEDKIFEDNAYFEPFYLKEFVATIAKNKVFN